MAESDPATKPSKEALEAAHEALSNNLADTVRDIERVIALALDRFRAAGVREERKRCANIAHNNGKYSERFADGDLPDEIVFHNHACWSIRDAIRKGETP